MVKLGVPKGDHTVRGLQCLTTLPIQTLKGFGRTMVLFQRQPHTPLSPSAEARRGGQYRGSPRRTELALTTTQSSPASLPADMLVLSEILVVLNVLEGKVAEVSLHARVNW